MSGEKGLDRRAFLKKAGVTAALGAAVGTGTLGAESALAAPPAERPALDPDGDYVFSEVPDRRGTGCAKWDGAIDDYGEGVDIAMGIADQDFFAAPCIAEALDRRCRHENWGYHRVQDSFYEAIAAYNERHYGVTIDPDSLELTTGVHAGLIAAIETFAPPGERVLLTTPVYSGFYSDIEFTDTVAEESPMRLVDGRYQIDFDDFERRARRSSVFILCNPQNPTGNCWSAEDMLRMGEICLENRVVVLSDEIHCDFVTDHGNDYTPFASLPNRDVVDNSLTFKSASKSFSISAMKVAWYHSTNPTLLERVRKNTRSDIPTLGLVATEAALREGDAWLEELLAYLEESHDYATSRIQSDVPLVDHVKPEGTYLAWLDIRDLMDAVGAEQKAAAHRKATGEELTPEQYMRRWFVNETGVFLNPGSWYGPGGEGRMRMNLATKRERIERALDRIADVTSRV